MKALLLAAAAISGLGTSSAHADGGVPPANTMFTQFPGVLAEAPHAVAPASNEQGVEDYVTSRTVSRGRSRQTRTAATTNKQRRELEAGRPTIRAEIEWIRPNSLGQGGPRDGIARTQSGILDCRSQMSLCRLK